MRYTFFCFIVQGTRRGNGAERTSGGRPRPWKTERAVRARIESRARIGFAYPSRRSESLLSRRRERIYCSKGAICRRENAHRRPFLTVFFILSKPTKTRRHLAQLCYVRTLFVADFCSHLVYARIGFAFQVKPRGARASEANDRNIHL